MLMGSNWLNIRILLFYNTWVRPRSWCCPSSFFGKKITQIPKSGWGPPAASIVGTSLDPRGMSPPWKGISWPLGQWDLRRADVSQWCSGARQSMRIFLFKKSKKWWNFRVPEINSTGGLKLKLFGPSFEGSDKTPNGICVRDRCRNTSVNLDHLADKQTNASFLESAVLD